MHAVGCKEGAAASVVSQKGPHRVCACACLSEGARGTAVAVCGRDVCGGGMLVCVGAQKDSQRHRQNATTRPSNRRGKE